MMMMIKNVIGHAAHALVTDRDRQVVASDLAGSGLSRSNRGPVALCTPGLDLLNHPSLNGR